MLPGICWAQGAGEAAPGLSGFDGKLGFMLAQSDQPGIEPTGPGGRAYDPNLDPEYKAKNEKEDIVYAVGITGRFLFIPAGFLEAFMQKAMGMYSGSIGIEFIRRMEILDIIAAVNFGFYNPPDGTWLGDSDKKPSIDTDWVHFDTFDVLSLGVTFVGHHFFHKKVSLVYGGGVGLAIPVGKIMRVDATNCKDFGNLDTCIPNSVPETDRDKWVNNTNNYRTDWLADEANHCPDDEKCPDKLLYKEDGVWPVFPLLHLMLGVNFHLHKNWNIRIDGGFHNAFYFGLSGDYLF